MTPVEIVRRLKALIAMPREKRPVSIFVFERIAGVSRGMVYDVAKKEVMLESTRQRFERALTWLENGQLQLDIPKPIERITKRKKAHVTIGAVRPPQLTVSVVRFTPRGPQIRTVAYNPLAFPVMPEREES